MAFLHEPERQPFLRVPAAPVALIAILVAAHVARVLAPASVSNAIVANYAFFPARYSHAFLTAHSIGPQSFWDQAAPFVGYMFIHANFTHLAVNCIWLLPFAAITARRFGTLAFYALFLVCGAAGAAVYLATHWGLMSYVIGASGAVSGVMAAGFRIVAPVEESDLQSYSAAVSRDLSLHRPLAPILSPRVLAWTAIWTAINILTGVTGLGAVIGQGPQLIAWEVHMGGYLTGLLLAGPFDALGRRLSP